MTMPRYLISFDDGFAWAAKIAAGCRCRQEVREIMFDPELAREFEEELAIQINVATPIDSYIFEVLPERNVRIVTYGCTLAGSFAPRISDEHTEYCVCPIDELGTLNLPSGYRQSIERWCTQ